MDGTCPICGETVTRYEWEAGVTTYYPCGETRGTTHAETVLEAVAAEAA